MFWLALVAAAFGGALTVWLWLRNIHAVELATLQERVRGLGDARERLTHEFQSLAAEALARNNQQFVQLANARQAAVDDMVRPLKASLDKVDAQIQAMENTRAGAYAAIATQVKIMSEEARRLSEALRTPSARGRWGEVQLRRVVEMAGMLSFCDFEEQFSLSTEGGRLRPDLVVRLPNEKRIVVDAKVPLKAYLESLEEPTEAGRATKLKEHAQQVRRHMKSLGEKSYWSQFAQMPEFVVAFLPGEVFFSAALQQDPELLEFGVANNIILATPTTLIALLKAVSFGWKQEQFTQNAQEIRELGCTLYERIRVFAEHYNEVGRSLNKAVSSYSKGKISLETRLTGAARRFEELGVGKGELIPEIYGGDLLHLVPETLSSNAGA